MIAVRLQGRLGNQMFQYAFILVASKKLNTDFYIDQYIERSALDKYFNNISGLVHKAAWRVFGITGYKNLFSFYLRRQYYNLLVAFNKLAISNYSEKETAQSFIFQNNALYLGFFQSANFFMGNEDLIRKKFSLKPYLISNFNDKYQHLAQHKLIVAVHIRQTDYMGLAHLNLGGADLSLPLNYYEKAIAAFDGQNAHFVFVSDDIPFVKQHFGHFGNKTISTDTEINDFQHLLNAHACIISNSTFSWWGAWLNNRADKVIYAPKYFLGWRVHQQMPPEIYPDNWIQIDF